MISLTEARACIAAHAQPLEPAARPLREARGRVLRRDIAAPHDLPAFDRSAMDGYAVGLDDPSPRFRVIGEVQPGPLPAITLGPGECVRIFTGAPIPPGASQVIMQEDVERDGEWIVPRERERETHIRRRGEDVRTGDVVLRAGHRLHAAELSLLAHLGVVKPLVSAPVRVMHIATGRELVDPAATPGPGEIRDSNSTLIAALVEAAGARLVHQARVGDDLDAVVKTVGSYLHEAHQLLLLSGGASVGDYDFGAAALRQLGFEIHFTKVSLRPGKPLVFGSSGGRLAFVIPGNPVSHYVLFQVAIRAAIECLEGGDPSWPLVHLPLAEPLESPPEARETFWPARLAGGQVHPLRWQSSGDLSGLTGANLLIQVAPKSGPWRAGDLAPCLLLND